MAIALSRFDDPQVVTALEEALRQEEEPEVQLYLLWALGGRNAKSAVDQILPFLKNPREDLRNMAAYTLGVLADPKAVLALVPLLDAAERDVRWNAALSLARLGDDSGYLELTKMLDRQSLVSYHQMLEAKVEEVMINAIKGVALLKRPDALPLLAELSNNDRSLKVRQAAIEALDYQKQ